MVEFLGGLLIGGYVGWWLRKRYGRKYGARQDTYYVTVSPTTTVVLREFGKLDHARALALCARIAGGRPIRYRSMVGRGKLLRRGEWDRLIAGEWRARGWMVRGTDRVYHPSPECISYCERWVPSHARTGTW